jgi:hypothetical protein
LISRSCAAAWPTNQNLLTTTTPNKMALARPVGKAPFTAIDRQRHMMQSL